jgi:hypothetical protein
MLRMLRITQEFARTWIPVPGSYVTITKFSVGVQDPEEIKRTRKAEYFSMNDVRGRRKNVRSTDTRQARSHAQLSCDLI